MASFDEAYKVIDKNEGGYAFVSGDDGGETYNGISRVWHPKWAGWKVLDMVPPPQKKTNAKFPQLDVMVKQLFKDQYWNFISGDLIKSQKVANVIFDYAVTSGPQDAVVALQKVARVTVDGLFGPASLKAINAIDEYMFLVDFCMERLLHYAITAKQDPGDRKFLYGWWIRTARFVK